MYAGQIVEQARLQDLYNNPRHPYTIGLLQSIPRLDEQRQERLKPIEGIPPSLTHYPQGCPFAERCQFAIAHCIESDPSLETVDLDHQVACWVRPDGRDILRSPQTTLADG
jgi:oligopeptide transport system ATP-binding protein